MTDPAGVSGLDDLDLGKLQCRGLTPSDLGVGPGPCGHGQSPVGVQVDAHGPTGLRGHGPHTVQLESGIDDAGAPAADLPPLLALAHDSHGCGMGLGQTA